MCLCARVCVCVYFNYVLHVPFKANSAQTVWRIIAKWIWGQLSVNFPSHFAEVRHLSFSSFFTPYSSNLRRQISHPAQKLLTYLWHMKDKWYLCGLFSLFLFFSPFSCQCASTLHFFSADKYEICSCEDLEKSIFSLNRFLTKYHFVNILKS